MINDTVILAQLERYGIKTRTFYHEPLYTVEQAVVAYRDFPACSMVKNLFLKDDNNRLWLIVAMFDQKIQLKMVAKQLQAPGLRFASPDQLMDHLGVIPGSVTPLGIVNDTAHAVTLVFDHKLQKGDVIAIHPLRNDATTLVVFGDLLRFIKEQGNNVMHIDLD